MGLMMGDRSEETVSSLAARLSRLDNKLGAEDQEKIANEAGTSLTAIVRDLFDAIDPDKVEADAKAAGHPEPDDAAMQAAREERIRAGRQRLHRPAHQPDGHDPPRQRTDHRP